MGVDQEIEQVRRDMREDVKALHLRIDALTETIAKIKTKVAVDIRNHQFQKDRINSLEHDEKNRLQASTATGRRYRPVEIVAGIGVLFLVGIGFLLGAVLGIKELIVALRKIVW